MQSHKEKLNSHSRCIIAKKVAKYRNTSIPSRTRYHTETATLYVVCNNLDQIPTGKKLID